MTCAQYLEAVFRLWALERHLDSNYGSRNDRLEWALEYISISLRLKP